MIGNDRTAAQDPNPIEHDGIERIEELKRWYPDNRPLPKCDTFEIGLVLAGAVSAGAYTAGVMDFLFEALDQWYTLRADNCDLPQHNVQLRVISGASAGGINGAIAATVCRYSFPPISIKNASQDGSQNLFYNTWVNEIDINDLLDPSDLERKGPLRSVLNSECLESLSTKIIQFKGQPLNSSQRAWLADPFKLFLTLTNLQGVPYEVRFSGATGFGHQMMMHRDHMGFSVSVLPALNQSSAPDLRPLTHPNSPGIPEWKLLKTTALATSAFPLALATQILSRPGSDYKYRYMFPYGPTGPVYSKPRIQTNMCHDFAAVDGGTMNNEPFELAHRDLAGQKGHNPRSGKTARRAIIMVDPFADPREKQPVPDATLLGTFSALFPALVAQTRFKQIDLTLAEAEDVYSRFLIAPSRKYREENKEKRVVGSKALASGGLAGFLGFFCQDYRKYDYMLGRENCRRFLRDWFVLPHGNPLFTKWPQAALQNKTFESHSKWRKKHRQIIPLVGTAAQCQHLELWPKGKFKGYDHLKPKIEKRIKKLRDPLANDISNSLTSAQMSRWIMRSAIQLVWWLWLRFRICRSLKKWIDDARDSVNNR